MRLRAPERLALRHDARGFECGVPSLDDWVRHRAYPSQLIGGSRTFVACEADRIVGYYTVSAGGIAVVRRPPPDTGPQPIPVAVLGRVALDHSRHGHGLGRALVRDAVLRILQASHTFPVQGVLAEAISPDSRSFFAALGFEPSPIDDTTLLASFADLRLAAH